MRNGCMLGRVGALVAAVAMGSVSNAHAAVGVPVPAEGVSSLAARFSAGVAALEAGNCAGWLAWQRSIRPRDIAPCDDAARGRFSGFRITRAVRFGTGAVVNYVSAGHARGYTISFALGPGRRFVFNDALDPEKTAGVFGGSISSVPYARSLGLYLSGIRHHNCSLYWRYGVVFSDATQRVACRAAFGPPEAAVIRDIRLNPGARPVAFGGTRDWRFYGLRTKFHYYTIVVAHYADEPAHYTADPPIRAF